MPLFRCEAPGHTRSPAMVGAYGMWEPWPISHLQPAARLDRVTHPVIRLRRQWRHFQTVPSSGFCCGRWWWPDVLLLPQENQRGSFDDLHEGEVIWLSAMRCRRKMGRFPGHNEASAVKTSAPYCDVVGLTCWPPAAPNQADRRGVDGLPIWGAEGDRGHPFQPGGRSA